MKLNRQNLKLPEQGLVWDERISKPLEFLKVHCVGQ